MQLKKDGSMAAVITAATCTLLGVPVVSSALEGQGDWQIDGGLLVYSESGRVSAAGPVLQALRTFSDDSQLSLKLGVDSLTGSSHNGAAVADAPQTFTSPSGKRSYVTAAGDVPLDDTFRDTRVALGTQYTRALNRTLTTIGGLNVSKEYDFVSVAAHGGLSWDFNQRNTTLSAALGVENDVIDPVGGVPVPLSVQSNRQRSKTSESRVVTDALLGWTQVVNRSMIMRLNYNLSLSSGYMTDPYKVVTVSDGAGQTVEAESIGGIDIGQGDGHIFESRPDSRSRHSLYWETRYSRESGDVMVHAYRFTTDDWGISSHMADIKYRWMMGGGWFLQPHIRYYKQKRASFWTETLSLDEYEKVVSTSDDTTADYRLGDLQDITIGLKFGQDMGEKHRWDIRIEAMQQSGTTKAADVESLIGQFGFRLIW